MFKQPRDTKLKADKKLEDLMQEKEKFLTNMLRQ